MFRLRKRPIRPIRDEVSRPARHHRRTIGTFAVATLALAALVTAAPAASAGSHKCKHTITVQDLGDSGQPGQLRQALERVCDRGTIRVRPGTIALVDPDPLAVDDGLSVTIVPLGSKHHHSKQPSAGLTITPGGTGGVFYVAAGAELSLGGTTLDGTGAGQGESGAIYNAGALRLCDVTIKGFVADFGGAILNDGSAASVKLTGSTTLTGNRSTYPTRGHRGRWRRRDLQPRRVGEAGGRGRCQRQHRW